MPSWRCAVSQARYHAQAKRNGSVKSVSHTGSRSSREALHQVDGRPVVEDPDTDVGHYNKPCDRLQPVDDTAEGDQLRAAPDPVQLHCAIYEDQSEQPALQGELAKEGEGMEV